MKLTEIPGFPKNSSLRKILVSVLLVLFLACPGIYGQELPDSAIVNPNPDGDTAPDDMQEAQEEPEMLIPEDQAAAVPVLPEAAALPAPAPVN
ncbi:MAG: hypothetical protein FWF22_07605, partial [Treponema sp.]|nr:hypothetical protein [Treponema sp.]